MRKVYFISLLILVYSCSSNKKTDKLEWDFSSPKVITYSYSQNVEISTLAELAGDSEQTVKTEGNLVVRIEEGGTANVSLENLSLTANDPLTNKEFSMDSPTITVKGMDSNGRFENDPASDMFFKLIFALPTQVLTEGKSEEIPISYPLNMYSGEARVNGSNSLTLGGNETIDGYECVKMESDIIINEMEVSEDEMSTYDTYLEGKGNYYFDPSNGCFVQGDLEFDMFFKVESKESGTFNSNFEMLSNYKLISIE